VYSRVGGGLVGLFMKLNNCISSKGKCNQTILSLVWFAYLFHTVLICLHGKAVVAAVVVVVVSIMLHDGCSILPTETTIYHPPMTNTNTTLHNHSNMLPPAIVSSVRPLGVLPYTIVSYPGSRSSISNHNNNMNWLFLPVVDASTTTITFPKSMVPWTYHHPSPPPPPWKSHGHSYYVAVNAVHHHHHHHQWGLQQLRVRGGGGSSSSSSSSSTNSHDDDDDTVGGGGEVDDDDDDDTIQQQHASDHNILLVPCTTANANANANTMIHQQEDEPVVKENSETTAADNNNTTWLQPQLWRVQEYRTRGISEYQVQQYHLAALQFQQAANLLQPKWEEILLTSRRQLPPTNRSNSSNNNNNNSSNNTMEYSFGYQHDYYYYYYYQ
jgi:hypothetical protein